VNECRICGHTLTHHPDCGNRARNELERVRAHLKVDIEHLALYPYLNHVRESLEALL
jgi:hypothetical protein